MYHSILSNIKSILATISKEGWLWAIFSFCSRYISEHLKGVLGDQIAPVINVVFGHNELCSLWPCRGSQLPCQYWGLQVEQTIVIYGHESLFSWSGPLVTVTVVTCTSVIGNTKLLPSFYRLLTKTNYARDQPTYGLLVNITDNSYCIYQALRLIFSL